MVSLKFLLCYPENRRASNAGNKLIEFYNIAPVGSNLDNLISQLLKHFFHPPKNFVYPCHNYKK